MMTQEEKNKERDANQRAELSKLRSLKDTFKCVYYHGSDSSLRRFMMPIQYPGMAEKPERSGYRESLLARERYFYAENLFASSFVAVPPVSKNADVRSHLFTIVNREASILIENLLKASLPQEKQDWTNFLHYVGTIEEIGLHELTVSPIGLYDDYREHGEVRAPFSKALNKERVEAIWWKAYTRSKHESNLTVDAYSSQVEAICALAAAFALISVKFGYETLAKAQYAGDTEFFYSESRVFELQQSAYNSLRRVDRQIEAIESHLHFSSLGTSKEST